LSPEAELTALSLALDKTLSMDAAVRLSGTADLDARALDPATYGPLLLRLVRSGAGASGGAAGRQARNLSAAIALKNLVLKRWKDAPASGGAAASPSGAENAATAEVSPASPTGGLNGAAPSFGPDVGEGGPKGALRRDVLAALLETDPSDSQSSKVLAEALRCMAVEDFPARWPQLLPALSEALSKANVPGGQAASASGAEGNPAGSLVPGSAFKAAPGGAVHLEQALLAVATLAKQFVYFQETTTDADNAAEKGSPVPDKGGKDGGHLPFALFRTLPGMCHLSGKLSSWL
jgi:hypothetical protein